MTSYAFYIIDTTEADTPEKINEALRQPTQQKKNGDSKNDNNRKNEKSPCR